MLVCVLLLLLPSIVPRGTVDAKRRAAAKKHHSATAEAAAVSTGGAEGEASDPTQLGGYLEEDEPVPLEAAEQHFHLLPARSVSSAPPQLGCL